MQIESVFTATFWDTLPNIDHMRTSNFPIFIVGMMRSGSTLLETMLDAHKNIYGMGEDSMFNGNLSAFRDELVTASSGGDGATWQEVCVHYTLIHSYTHTLIHSYTHALVNSYEPLKPPEQSSRPSPSSSTYLVEDRLQQDRCDNIHTMYRSRSQKVGLCIVY